MDKVYDNLKDWTEMFSNKFDVGIVYVFKVEIIIITFKFYSLGITKKKSNF
jgi:hypothetical protein